MEMLKASAAAACLLGIIFSVMGSMVATEKFSSQMNIIFTLILILVTVSPFVKNGTDIGGFTAELPDAIDYSDILEKNLLEEINGNICGSLEDILRENEIAVSKISVETNNYPDGSISITKAEITLISGNADKARALVRAALGEDAEIIIDAGGE
ncbi:MAG: hypothetical protein NC120_05650 [Ruminococcus sp.]|nr:hypothetical protein [Ruminococcus sp.]